MKERVETNFRGDTIETKLEPSLDGLGNNKETQRDANVVLGLFGPNRYGITDHLGYPITRFKDHYRCLHILKDRDGVSNKKVPMFFNGAIDLFKELPLLTEVERMSLVYSHLAELERLDRER